MNLIFMVLNEGLVPDRSGLKEVLGRIDRTEDVVGDFIQRMDKDVGIRRLPVFQLLPFALKLWMRFKAMIQVFEKIFLPVLDQIVVDHILFLLRFHYVMQ